jgi:hypothetical protein
MSRDEDVKARWFGLGAKALNNVLTPTIGDTYVCPLCRLPFERSQIAADLSFEHSPPERLGGNRIALTCRKCNSLAGTKLDAAAVRDEITRSFLAGGGKAPRTVRVTRDGIMVRGDLMADRMGFSFNAISKQNDPEILERFKNSALEWGNRPKEGRKIRIEIPVQFRSRRAHLSWLRVAYVAAFSTFGYTFVLQSGIEVLLEQFRQADDDRLIERLPLGFDTDAEETTREVAVITAPAVVRSVLVRVGKFTAYLPLPMDQRFFGEFHTRMEGAFRMVGDADQEAATFAIDSYGWPTEPRHLWDLRDDISA